MDRLGTIIKSYINDEDAKIFGKSPFGRQSAGEGGAGWKTRDIEWNIHDSDLDAAYEELDDFLRSDSSKKSKVRADEEKTAERKKPVPEEIKKDFEELGLGPEASAEECKEAYKKLLKIHHPDRHAKHEANMKKATDKTAKVNAAYERIMAWFKVVGSGE